MPDESLPRFDFIRQLCPSLSEAALADAERRFASFLDLLLDIAERQARVDSTERAQAPHTGDVFTNPM